MRKFLTTAMAIALGLTLAACGGKEAETAGTAEGSGKEAAPEVIVDPAEKFYGEWKIAYAETQGITLVGDFSALIGVDDGMVLKIDEGGTGSMALGDDNATFTWELKDDNTLTFTPDETEDEADDAAETDDAEEADESFEESLEDNTFEIAYADDVLSIAMDTEDTSGTICFTKDGTAEGLLTLAREDEAPFTSADELIGTWKFSGMNMMGITMYGDADALEQMTGNDVDSSITFNDDNTVTFMGEDTEWAFDAEKGAVLSSEGVEFPLVKIGDYLAIDLSDIFAEFADEESGMDPTFIMAFTKQ